MFGTAFVHGLLVASTLTVTPAECRGMPDPAAKAAVPNDNRVLAGTTRDGVLTLRLVARPAAWQPEGPSGCGLRVHAFAEEGKPASIPGPLIRVKVGTEVRVILRNELGKDLIIRGLFDRLGLSLGTERNRRLLDSTRVQLADGESREIRFRATVPGTFYYWGSTPYDTAVAFPNRVPGAALPIFPPFDDSQLVGALIVDPQGGSPPDRILVLTHWLRSRVEQDEGGRRQINAVNGLSWPHTERLAATVGDTVRWRVLNTANAAHTMHLHGFYFRVVSQGLGATFDSILPGPAQRMVVSEFMAPNRTITMEWAPERAGNWLFHCHWVAHMGPAQRLDRVFDLDGTDSAPHASHADDHMAGLVVGVSVRPSPTARAPDAAAPRRYLRLFASERARVFGEDPGYGFVLQEGPNAPAADSIRIPGSPIMLTKGEPTQITVFNRLRFPLAVHWHGIELESYYDGVPHFSGDAGRIAPAIAPGDSFVVRMTPPRAGTFFYHIHSENGDELNAGLYGPLIVVDPARPFDASVDHTFVLSGGRRAVGNPLIFVNGSSNPDAIEVQAGVTQRWRFISIGANGSYDVRVTGTTATTPVWHAVARDGADLPPEQAVVGQAQVRIGVGIAMDFEFIPTSTGDLILQVDLPRGPVALAGFATHVPIRVVAARRSDAVQDTIPQRRILERALALLDDASSRTSPTEPGLDLSGLLWTVFCQVESELQPGPQGGGNRTRPCASVERSTSRRTADGRTLDQARTLVQRALDATGR